MTIALITGITGQDGSYLAEFLVDRGYEVHGLMRRSSLDSTGRIKHLHPSVHDNPRIKLHCGDLTDPQSLTKLILEIAPDEIYNLGAQSHVQVSFELPVYTMMANGLGALAILEAAKQLKSSKPVRVYQASSSEMFGKVSTSPQNEATPFRPQSPYACSKVYSHFQSINYREAYGIYVANGILFNHESPRRGETFVTRKITRAATRIKMGLQDKLFLGNLESRRDWGYAQDYVDAMWRMLQQDQPDDYVIGTGTTHSIRQFVEIAFSKLDLDWKQHVELDARYLRPADVELLVADPTKAKRILGWKATTSLDRLIDIMLEHDLALAKSESLAISS